MALLHRSRIGACVIAALLAWPVWAVEPLTLREAQALAVARSKELAAGTSSITASREMAVAAGRLPDPVLKFGIDNLPVAGPDRWSLTRDFMTMRRIGLSQELPNAAKRQLRSQRFERAADRARAERQVALANVERETALAWIDRHYTQQMRVLVQQQAQETGLQVQTTQSSYATGRNTQADALGARAALVMVQDRLSQVDRQARNAASALERWIGGAAAGPFADAPPPWQRSRFEQGALEDHLLYHPDLVMARTQVQAARTEARLAQAETKPDWSVEAMYSQRGPGYSNMVSVAASVPLQWDQKNRQDREVAARLSMVDEAQARFEEMLRQHEASTQALLNDWRTGKERVVRYRDELVPLAMQRTQAALVAYRSGKGDLASTLAARREELDARMQALTIEMETARAWAQLDFLIPDHNTAAHVQGQP